MPNARAEGTNKCRTCAGLWSCQVLSAPLTVGLDFKSSFLPKKGISCCLRALQSFSARLRDFCPSLPKQAGPL